MIFLILLSILSKAQGDSVQAEMLKDSALSLKKQGIKMVSKGEMEKAKQLFLKELKVKQSLYALTHPEIGHTYVNIGVVYKKQGNYKSALEYYQKAENIYNGNSSTPPGKAGTNYSNIANIYTLQKNYNKAERYYQKALELFLTDSVKNRTLIAMTYNNYGIVQKELNEYKKAIDSYKTSYAIYKSLNSESIVLPIGNLALLYADQKKYKKAEKHFKESIEHTKTFFGDTYFGLVNNYLNYGILMLNQKKYNEAQKLIEKALIINKKHFNESHPRTARCYNNLGTLFERQNNYAAALKYYQKSLNSLSPVFKDTSIYNNPDISEVYSKVELIKVLKNKALVLNKYPDTNTKYKELALQTYESATNAIEKLRKGYLSQESKLFITSHEKETYSEAMKTAYRLYSLSKKEKYLNKAFQYSEKGKSAVLLDNLQASEARQLGNIPDTLQEKENSLKKKIYRYEELIFEEQKKMHPEENKISYWKNQIFKFNQKLNELVEVFEQKYPDYYALKYQGNQINISYVQSKMNKNQGLLEFSVLKNNFFLFYIEKDTLLIKKIRKDSTILKNIHALRKFLTQRNFSTHNLNDYKNYTQNSLSVYSKLLSFLPLKNINKLTIIPDDVLSYIPFEILITNKPDTNRINYRNINYLIKNQDISYSYSARILFSKQKKNKENRNVLAAFAPTYGNIKELSKNQTMTRQHYREKLYPLKGISREVHAIAPLFNGDIYENEEATEEKFKKTAHKYQILHLAMHTLINDKNPLYSKMAFTQNKDSLEDGFLNTYEIYNLKLNSNLAVLSSCNTGTGKHHKGEGVISLARGFKHAGCPSIVMTMWPVEDNSSIDLMKYFYQELKKGKNKAEALKTAKLKYLDKADPLHAHPYFWSGYIVIGDVSPIFKTPLERALIYLIPGFLVLFILLYFVIKRINKKNLLKRKHSTSIRD